MFFGRKFAACRCLGCFDLSYFGMDGWLHWVALYVELSMLTL